MLLPRPPLMQHPFDVAVSPDADTAVETDEK